MKEKWKEYRPFIIFLQILPLSWFSFLDLLIIKHWYVYIQRRFCVKNPGVTSLHFFLCLFSCINQLLCFVFHFFSRKWKIHIFSCSNSNQGSCGHTHTSRSPCTRRLVPTLTGMPPSNPSTTHLPWVSGPHTSACQLVSPKLRWTPWFTSAATPIYHRWVRMASDVWWSNCFPSLRLISC